MRCCLGSIGINKRERTKQPHLRQAYQQAAEQASRAVSADPLTQTLSGEEQQQWWSWSLWMVSKFQRTSSAVEGRNGWLAQVHHANRGIERNTLQALKIIHNYGLKRADGTTAAQRLFGREQREKVGSSRIEASRQDRITES